MTPAENRKETLKQLRAARKSMISKAWLLSLKDQPEKVRREAAVELLNIEQAILELSNTTLSDIRDKLVENKADLLKGRENLEEALARLTCVKTVLKAVGDVLVVVGKVVKFVATAAA